jgi:Domain of unknown function (DUF4158)
MRTKYTLVYLGQSAMPRRRVLTATQLDELFTLPTEKSTLVHYWTLADTDLEAIHRRRRDRNRVGFALQLCALRYRGSGSNGTESSIQPKTVVGLLAGDRCTG